MFGYVVCDKSSLRIREYDYYRATYCGLCHAMGECTGQLSRLTLSYDMAFFVLVRESIAGEVVQFEKKRCIRHPIFKINTIAPNESMDYSAFVGGIMCTRKLDDDIRDEEGIKKFIARACKLIFKKMGEESAYAIPEIDKFVEKKLLELSTIEEKREASVDAPAEIFGEIMSRLLSFGFEGDKHKIAEVVGKKIGRWVYMVDALDDYDDDRKTGSYNPFVELYAGKDFTSDDSISISSMLEAELSDCLSALELIDDEDRNRCEVIRNILCLGMPAKVKNILYKENGGDAE